MWLIILVGVLLPFGVAAWIGAPYLPILRRDGQAALDLLALRPGQTLLDLGSGDGRLLRAAAQRGIRGVGYEINPFLYVISLAVTWRYRHLVRIHLADFWRARLPPVDAVYVFLIDRLMPKLDAKLRQDIHQPTPVVSFIFRIPSRTASQETRNAWRYEYPINKAPKSFS